MELGKQLRELRKKHNLTQKQLASYAGVAQSVVSNAESGEREPSLDSLEKFCKVFELSLSSFFALLENKSSIAASASTDESGDLSSCLSEDEITLIHKYQLLSLRDKATVNGLIEILSKQKKVTSSSLINGNKIVATSDFHVNK